MIRIFQWLWDKAERRAYERILSELQSMADYHRIQSAELELHPPKDNGLKHPLFEPFYSSKDHMVAYDCLRDAARRLSESLSATPQLPHKQEK